MEELLSTVLTPILSKLENGDTDPYGASVFYKDGVTSDGKPALSLYIQEPGSSQKKHIGLLYEEDSELVYYKTESEKDKHRNTLSWTIAKWIIPYVSRITLETDFATYTTTKDGIDRDGFYTNYKASNRGFMAKIHLRCKDWIITCKDPKDQKRIDLMGYEWYSILKPEFESAYMQELGKQVMNLRKMTTVYPEGSETFNAFKFTPYNNVRVVILGQDPYHDGNAHGLAFSIKNPYGMVPPSLRNIMAEVEADFGSGFLLGPSANLEHWAKQGVLLLNTVLTVEKGYPESHSKIGWQQFTKVALQRLLDRPNSIHRPLVFMLWGRHAQQFEGMIDHNIHLVLTTTHPSPFSAHKGFVGCRHFTKCNKFLESTKQDPIIW